MEKQTLQIKSILFKMIFMSLVMILVVGCNQTETTSDGASSKSSKGNSEPKSGGTLSIPIDADPTFNPWHPNAQIESVFVNNVLFNGLTKLGEEGVPIGDLAEDWEISEDELEWTFNLREDVTWHDGEHFTAEDVAYTFNEIVLADIGAYGGTNFNLVDNVEVIDTFKVVFHLKKPFASLSSYLAYDAGILPKHIFEGEDPINLVSFNKEGPVGTGPFKFDKYISGQSTDLVANPDYFGGAPYIDRIVYKVLSDTNTQIAQALSNELSILNLQDFGSIERIESANNLEIHPQFINRFDMMTLYQEVPLFKDVKVRQAIMHAIDRQAIIDTVLHGYAKVADSAITPALENFYTEDVKKYEYNPEKALELLSEAGWKDTNGDGLLDKGGETFSFTLDVGQIGVSDQVGQMIQQYLLDLGIDMELNVMEWNSLMDKVAKRDYDAYMSWWVMPDDPDIFPYFHSSVVDDKNRPAHRDENLDKLLELGQQVSDPEERKEIYIEVQKLIADTVPYHFLWYPQELQVRNVNLKGIPDLPIRNALKYINEWWLEQ